MVENPPCACTSSTYHKCAWCPGLLAEEIKCRCQLHWILHPQRYPGVQGGLGLGICFRCVARHNPYHLHHLQADLQILDADTRVARGQLDLCVYGSVTQEVEVQGNFALSSSVDDRTGVRIWVQIGRSRAPPTNVGGRDTTTVEYRVTPFDNDVQRYLDEGFRAVDRSFDWDRPDRFNLHDGDWGVEDADEHDSEM